MKTTTLFKLLLIMIFALKADEALAQGEIHDISSDAKKGLQPHVQIQKYPGDWNIEIDFVAQTNVIANTWLKAANRIGSQLQLWSADGVEIPSTNIEVLAATRLPAQTTVSNAMQGVPWRRRAGQWLGNNAKGLSAGESVFSRAFSLKSAFNVVFTNDVTVKITPLLYNVGTNVDKAELILFAPVKVRLSADGKVINVK